MREMFLGEFIKNRRMELGLTQEQLCEGICEPITISGWLRTGSRLPPGTGSTPCSSGLGCRGIGIMRF